MTKKWSLFKISLQSSVYHYYSNIVARSHNTCSLISFLKTSRYSVPIWNSSIEWHDILKYLKKVRNGCIRNQGLILCFYTRGCSINPHNRNITLRSDIPFSSLLRPMWPVSLHFSVTLLDSSEKKARTTDERVADEISDFFYDSIDIVVKSNNGNNLYPEEKETKLKKWLVW